MIKEVPAIDDQRIKIMTQKRIKITTVFFLFAFMFSALITCEKDNPPDSRYPEATAQNFDVLQLGQAIDDLADIPGFRSIVVGRNGVIAAEEYYNNSGPDSLHDLRSVAKSVMGLLTGIAIREGFIQSVDQTIGEFLIGTVVNSLTPDKARITIEQLLNMSCGLEWHELDGGTSYDEWFVSDDHVQWVLDQAFIHLPGDGFNYNTGSSYLLSVLLYQATGQDVSDFARQYLFEPMGIDHIEWDYVPRGGIYNNGGAGITISPHTMFAIGNLVLNGGNWDQNQIVPEDWIHQCISNQNETTGTFPPYSDHYGYLWWIGQAHGHDHFFAMGWGGQFLVCVPDFQLVVAAACQWGGISVDQASQNLFDIFMIIMDDIITAMNE